MKKDFEKKENYHGTEPLGEKPYKQKLSSKKARLGKKRLKDYGKVLLAKQLMRALYNNPREKIFKKYFGKDKSMNDVVGALSSRLEIVLTAMGGAISNSHARQLINHGKISVNGHVVKERGYLLKDGDIVASSVDFVSKDSNAASTTVINSQLTALKVASLKPKKIPGFLKLKTPIAASLLVNSELNYGIYYSKNITLDKVKAVNNSIIDTVGLGWKNTNVKAIKTLLLEMKVLKEDSPEQALKLCAVLYNLVQAYYSRVR